jgi:hypothetical protein
MARGRFLWLGLLVLAVGACQYRARAPLDLPPPLAFEENPEVVGDCRLGDGTGILVMRENGKNQVHIVQDLAAGTSGAPIQPPPMLGARPLGRPFPGRVVHCQIDTVENEVGLIFPR